MRTLERFRSTGYDDGDTEKGRDFSRHGQGRKLDASVRLQTVGGRYYARINYNAIHRQALVAVLAKRSSPEPGRHA